MRRVVVISLSILIALLAASVAVQAICLEVDMNVCEEEFPGADWLLRATQTAASLAASNPSDPSLAVEATNSRLAAEKGLQYSFPATLYVELGENGSVDRYRIEYLQPVIEMLAPSFVPEDPPIRFDEKVTIIFDGDRKYIARTAVDSGKITSEEWQETWPPRTEQAEEWYRPYVIYLEKVQGSERPAVDTASMKRYVFDEPFRGALEVIDDANEVVLYAGDIDDPKSYVRFKMASYQGHAFPAVVECYTKGQSRTTHYMEIKGALDSARAAQLFAIPEKVAQGSEN